MPGWSPVEQYTCRLMAAGRRISSLLKHESRHDIGLAELRRDEKRLRQEQRLLLAEKSSYGSNRRAHAPRLRLSCRPARLQRKCSSLAQPVQLPYSSRTIPSACGHAALARVERRMCS